MNKSFHKTSKRIATLNQEQIAYINGCAILQKAVWRMTHRDPLSALWSQNNKRIIKRAVNILIIIREKSRESYFQTPDWLNLLYVTVTSPLSSKGIWVHKPFFMRVASLSFFSFLPRKVIKLWCSLFLSNILQMLQLSGKFPSLKKKKNVLYNVQFEGYSSSGKRWK